MARNRGMAERSTPNLRAFANCGTMQMSAMAGVSPKAKGDHAHAPSPVAQY
jgi:hypothetical protein